MSRDAEPVKERPEETDRLERTLTGGMPEGNHLILTAETVDRRKKLFKTISSAGRILSFTKVKGEARQQQAVQEMAAELLAPERKETLRRGLVRPGAENRVSTSGSPSGRSRS